MAAAFIDREQGGLDAIRREGVNAAALLRITEVIDILIKNGLISDELRNSIINYLVSTRVNPGTQTN